MSGARTALGFRALKGGGALVAVTLNGDAPRLALFRTLATAAEGDRLSLEPYTLAAEMERAPDGGASEHAKAAVAEGRRRQDRLAAEGLAALLTELREDGRDPIVAALLVNRAGWITDLLQYSLAWADHPPVAEGLAVRDAFRFACGETGLDLKEVDEKSLPDAAPNTLGLAQAEIDAAIKAMGAEAGRPWRKEQKLAALAAWTALAERR